MTPTRMYFFRDDLKEKGGSTTQPSVSEKKETEDEKFIRCSQCLQPITRPSDRISIDGSHTHTFANPSGILYEIGCFRSVIGCGFSGPTTDEFTWFKGYGWKVAYCGKCLTHLGWLFMSSGNSFNGLILDRLSDS